MRRSGIGVVVVFVAEMRVLRGLVVVMGRRGGENDRVFGFKGWKRVGRWVWGGGERVRRRRGMVAIGRRR